MSSSPTSSPLPAPSLTTPSAVLSPILEPATYDAIHTGCIGAIADEIEAVMRDIKRWGGDKPARVRRGRLETIEGENYFYTFEIDRSVLPPEFTWVDIIVGSKTTRGVVEEVLDDGWTLLISTDERLDGHLDDAAISFDPTGILRAMRVQIEALTPNGTHPNLPTVLRTLGLTPAHVGTVAPVHRSIQRRGLNQGQIDAIGQATESEVSLIFGPPGTGKTRTLGSLVAELVETHGRRVLVTAHTNTALDTAMASVVDALDQAAVTNGWIVRLGKVSRDFRHLDIGLRDVATRLARAAARALSEELAQLEAELDRLVPRPAEYSSGTVISRVLTRRAERERRAGRGISPEHRLAGLLERIDRLAPGTRAQPAIARLADRLRALEAEQREQARHVAHGAKVVGATLSRLCIAPEEVGPVDAVIVDEGSMAMLPQVMVAASLARRQVVVLGDPQQLPPVVQSDSARAQQFLKRDLFRHLRVDDPAVDDPRRPMLTTQYRMDPSIRALVSNTFYAGRLVDDPSVTTRTPRGGANLVLLDTSRTGATSERRGSSRVNEAHAEVVADLVQHLVARGETDIGIITPFAAQSKVLRQVVFARHPGFFRLGGFVRTIHRAQGGEKDTIIIDLVDAPPRMSSFLDDTWNRDLARLACVAHSRARHRLILVAHAQAFRQQYGRRGALIMRLLETAYREGHYVALTETGLLPDDVVTTVLGGPVPPSTQEPALAPARRYVSAVR